ncbi:MAG: formyltransferase family protein, partial [Nanoarchaeota archaeon]
MVAILNIGVLGSTRGTDLQAVIDAIDAKELNARISAVVSNKKDAYILERAGKHNIEAVFIDSKGKEREDFDREISKELQKHRVNLILAIGYMRIFSPWFVNKWKNRIINIHPSLLPQF